MSSKEQPPKGLVTEGGQPLKSDKAEANAVTDPEKLSRVIWEPMPGKVAVKVLGERDTWGKGGRIIRPATAVRPRTTAKVIAVYDAFIDYGDTEESKPFLSVGDIVVFGQHAGIEVEYGNDKVIILREQEILTRVKLENPEDIGALGVAPGQLDDVEA